MDLSLELSHFWAPSTPLPPEKPRRFRLRRGWSELGVVRGRYNVNTSESPPPGCRVGLASLCTGRRRSKTEGSADLKAKSRFRTRSSPETPVYKVTASLVTDHGQTNTVVMVTQRPRSIAGYDETSLQLRPVSSTVVEGLEKLRNVPILLSNDPLKLVSPVSHSWVHHQAATSPQNVKFPYLSESRLKVFSLVVNYVKVYWYQVFSFLYFWNYLLGTIAITQRILMRLLLQKNLNTKFSIVVGWKFVYINIGYCGWHPYLNQLWLDFDYHRT